MTFYGTYSTALNALKSELEEITLSAHDDMKFQIVEFGPWEQRKEPPCCQILEGSTDKMIVSLGQGYQQVEITVDLHLFIEHPWTRTRGSTLTARDAILKTIGDVWDHFMAGNGKTLASTVQDCVPISVSMWDLIADWSVYHSIVTLSIRVIIAGV